MSASPFAMSSGSRVLPTRFGMGAVRSGASILGLSAIFAQGAFSPER